jgi:DNA-binding NarL/FixJ family response regulator
MIRLLIADDHAIVRSGLKQIFALTSDIDVAGEAESGTEVLECLSADTFDLLLLDLTMPDGGMDLVSRIRARHAALPILVLSMHNEPQVAASMLKAGANGYITKDCDSENLLVAIRRVASGGRYIDPILAEGLAFDAMLPDQRVPHARLSEREFEIFLLLVAGNGINEIADSLRISNKTVSTHKARLMEKMGISSNAGLVRYAVEHHLAPLGVISQ